MQDYKPFAFRYSPLSLAFTMAACCAVVLITGCAATVPMEATAYDIHVKLDPIAHRLTGQATLNLRCKAEKLPDNEPVVVEFALNRGLEIQSITGTGVQTGEHSFRKDDKPRKLDGQEGDSPLNIHRLVLDDIAEEFMLNIEYEGELFQDVQAGEEQGRIHNFLMSAHVDTAGIYLNSSGGWYPFPYSESQEDQASELANYRLTAEPVLGMELVASARFDASESGQSGFLVWNSTYPTDGLVLVGGPHQIRDRQVGDIRLALHYTPSDDADNQQMLEHHTDLFLDAAEDYLKRYEPLVGPYPFKQFTIVENFFSSGFAFPEFTLLARVLLEMGPKALKHGYLDHEFLHAWWGNSIYVDPSDGNWCESLASYGANYYGYVLDGDEKGSRKQRRNCCNFLSRIKPENDKPLGTFGLDDGAGRGIGYSKGTMVFHMLARKIGQENFWAAIRRLTDEYTGEYASWQILKSLFEQQSEMDLDSFFQQWVRSGGAPSLKLLEATWRSDIQTLEVTIDQGETTFGLAVPLRIIYENGTSCDEVVEIEETVSAVHLQLNGPPRLVILDPDYHVFRKLQPTEVMPTTGMTRVDKKLLVVKPEDEVSKFYQTVVESFGDKDGSKKVTERNMSDLSYKDLEKQSVLILGEAVRNEHVQTLLSKTNCPIRWLESGFSIEGVTYDQPGQSVLCTVHHPEKPGSGITIYYGNSEDALGRSDLLLFYGNSLVAFATAAKEVEGEKQYDSSVILRLDFESQEEIEVTK